MKWLLLSIMNKLHIIKLEDVNSLIAVFNELGNPFLECSKDLLTLMTKDIMDEDLVKSIYWLSNLV